jgi:HPt (histidine-containing phosphotransfer) domain-containing protein
MPTEQFERVSDFIHVDDLMNRCMGSIDFATRILGALATGCGSDMDELQQAVVDGDSDHVAEVAHRLKGALANCGARGLSQQADQICHAAQRCAPEQLQRQISEFREKWDRFALLLNDTQFL